MPELRQNMATKEWVIFAPARAKRPEDFKAKKQAQTEKPEFSSSCPFCPGNEKHTPATICELKDENDQWKIRVVPNKFPALLPEGQPLRRLAGIYREMAGVGRHEVIIETPVHNLTTALLSVSQIEDILRVYKMRYQELEKDPRVAMVIVFKNHGESAGTSLEHPHSQLVATPVVPTPIRHRIEEAMRYYDDTGECVHCKMLKEELKEKERIVLETEHFGVFVPFAAVSPFHTWIVPKTHRESFSRITEEEITDLAGVLKETLEKIYYGLGNPDFNYVFRVAPCDQLSAGFLHWYISIIPRLTRTAGFELGSGMFINTSLPEDDARFLREVKVSG